MQALILVGGEGTRLRPLTVGTPKPVVSLVDRPFIVLMFEWLARHGVDEVILSCGFRADRMREVLDPLPLPVSVRYVEEPRPLGTGGALKYAEEHLDDRFFMLNGDSLTDLDLGALLAQHERTGASGTLMLVRVEDPSAFGLVRLGEGNEVVEFMEKPSVEEAAGVDTVSGGAYVLDRRVLDLLEPGRPASIERDVFPRLVGDGLHGHIGSGYWLDIGTPARYLDGTFDLLEGRIASAVKDRLGSDFMFVAPDVVSDGRIVPAALVEAGCRIGAGAQIGGRAVLQRGVTVGARSTVEGSVVLEGAEIGAGCVIRDAVIGAGARVGDNTHVEGHAMLGEGVRVGADNQITNGARLFPGVAIPDGGLRF